MADLKKDSATPAQKQVAKWLNLINASLLREKSFRENAKRLNELYEAQKTSANSFNILYANTETMRPAVLSAIPRPRVRQRYPDSQPIANLAAQAVQRALEYFADTGNASQSLFGNVLKEATRQALVPGRGLAVFNYEPTISGSGYGDPAQTSSPEKEQKDGDNSAEAVQDATPSNQVATETEDVESETICGYSLGYDRVVFGYAAIWDDIPWIAIEYSMTREDLVRMFGRTKAEEIPLDKRESPAKDGSSDDDDQQGVPNTACVYAVWHKAARKVIFVCQGYPDGPLKEVDDPLGLSGFYPIPEQLCFFLRANSLIPVPLYQFYREQAQELNRVSARINKLISVMKARGLYDATLVNLNELQSREDGQFQPLNNVAALGQNFNLQNAVWVWPIEKFVTVLQQLYLQREQTKQVIYEISGLSDIIRGSTVASETATAQKIKNQWGTLRLQDSQNLVGVFSRNCFRIMAEIAINRFQPKTWKRITGMDLPLQEEKDQAQQQLQQITAMGGQIQQQMQQAGIQDPSQLPPEIQQKGQEMMQQAQKLQAVIAKPSWEDLLKELKENVKDGYLIDIQTNSTLDATMTEDKADLNSLITAISQMMQALAPMTEQGVIPLKVVKTLLISVLQSYRFGDEVMDQIRALPDEMPKKEEGPDPKVQAEMQLLKAKGEYEQQSNQMDLEAKKADLSFKQQELKMKQEEAALEHEIKMQEMQDKKVMNAQNMQQKQQLAQQRFQQQMVQALQPPAPAGTPSAAV